MDASSFPDTMEYVLHVLRAEGFYAAEAALKREIEERCEQLDEQEQNAARHANPNPDSYGDSSRHASQKGRLDASCTADLHPLDEKSQQRE